MLAWYHCFHSLSWKWKKWKVPISHWLTPYHTAPTFMDVHWELGSGGGRDLQAWGVGTAGEGGAEHSNGRLDGSHERQNCGTLSSVACSCQADFILHIANIYWPFYHAEDTLLGTRRDTQECDTVPLSGKEFLVWLEDSYQLAANTSYSSSLFAKHLQANHSPLNSLWVETLLVPSRKPVKYYYSYFSDRKLWHWKLSSLTWGHPFVSPEMPLLLLR